MFSADVRDLMMRCFGGSAPAKTSSVSFSFIGNVFPASVTTISFAANTDTSRCQRQRVGSYDLKGLAPQVGFEPRISLRRQPTPTYPILS